MDVANSVLKGSRTVLLSDEMFLALLLWSAVVTVLTVVTLLMMWFADDSSLRHLRDAHQVDQR